MKTALITKYNKTSNILQEARASVIVTDKEKALKKKLIALLKDDGEGHYHAAYAKRLEKFIVHIIP